MTQLHADHGGQHFSSKHLSEHPAQHVRPTRLLQTDAVFGTLFFEVILSADTLLAVHTLSGWTLRLWPRARLGDATLEAAPVQPGQSPDLNDLLHDLQAQGIQALGPVRYRRS